MTADKKADKKSTSAGRLLENGKYRKIVIFAGFAGILLIFLSSLIPSGKSTGASESPSYSAAAQEYETRLESSLTGIITQIEGAGSAKVMVTLEQTEESIYATEDKKSGQTASGQSEESSEKTYLLVKNDDGSESALAVTQVQPVIKGVVVVCDGGDDPAVKQNIVNAVTTALHVTSVRVCVLKAK
ncbi:MAG TPA: stage III sporulation protein AG [Ruminococcaceae bacterium]|jgi:stage III sporulation protein AG|nr:stage III sporulation protein AG [Oscillospiraceae bacterium]